MMYCTIEVKQAWSLHFSKTQSITIKKEYMTNINPKVLWDSLYEKFKRITHKLILEYQYT